MGGPRESFVGEDSCTVIVWCSIVGWEVVCHVSSIGGMSYLICIPSFDFVVDLAHIY